MKRLLLIGSMIFILCFELNAQLPPFKDVKINANPQSQMMANPAPETRNLLEDDYMKDIKEPSCHAEFDCWGYQPECLGMFIPDQVHNIDGNNHAFEFYIWSYWNVTVKLDGEVKEKDGVSDNAVHLDDIVWKVFNNGSWSVIPGYNPSEGDFYNYYVRLDNYQDPKYFIRVMVYPNKIDVKNKAQGEYNFFAKLTMTNTSY